MSKDPKNKYAKPPFPPQEQRLPGKESDMTPAPDYGKNSYKGCNKLQGKVALITGADSGIGRAVALAFAREGADIVIAYLSENDDAETIADDIRACSKRVLLMPGDISDENHCKTLVDRTIKEFGKLDILINNAAFQQRHSHITEIPSEEFEKTFRVNVFAMFYLTQYAFSKMKPGSNIINTTSIQSYQPSANLLAYASTKGAITTFTKAFAQEAIQKGIRVNAVAPGPVWTPFIPSSSGAKENSTFGADSPMKRPAQPIELAPVYVLLASDEASFITGHIYGVTGGETMQ